MGGGGAWRAVLKDRCLWPRQQCRGRGGTWRLTEKRGGGTHSHRIQACFIQTPLSLKKSHTHTHTHIPARAHTHTHAHTFARAHAHTHTHTRCTHTHICMYVCMYVSVWLCVCVYTYILTYLDGHERKQLKTQQFENKCHRGKQIHAGTRLSNGVLCEFIMPTAPRHEVRGCSGDFKTTDNNARSRVKPVVMATAHACQNVKTTNDQSNQP